MEPPEDSNLRAEFSQLEKFLMGESRDFRLPHLTPDRSPVSLTSPQDDVDTTMITGNNDGQTVRHWISLVNKSHSHGSSDRVAQPRSDFSSCNDNNPVPAPSYIGLPSQGWNPAQQAPTAAQPDPSPVPVGDLLARYSNNPPQLVMENMLSGHNSGKAAGAGSQAPSGAMASQNRNPASPAPLGTQQAQAPSNNTNVTPSFNDAFQQAQRVNEEGQHGSNPQPHPQASAVAKQNAGSSVATRFAAASQGVCAQSSNPSAQHSQFNNPYGFMTFPTLNSTGFASSQSGFEHDNGTHASVNSPAVMPGGSEDSMVLPMYTGSTFQDLVATAQRQNSLARQKRQQEAGPLAKNPRGRPRGSRKRRAPPTQQPRVDNEAAAPQDQDAAPPCDKRPYQRRKAEWNSLKMSGAIPCRRQMRNTRINIESGRQGWECPIMNPNRKDVHGGAATNPSVNPGNDQNFSGVESPSELWSLRSHPQSTAPLTGQINNNNVSLISTEKPPSRGAAASSKGKLPMEPETLTLIQPGNASTTSSVAPPRGNQITEASSLGVTSSMNNDQTIGGLATLAFSNPGGCDVSKMTVASRSSNRSGSRATGTGTYLQTYMDFTNACFGVTIQERTPSVPVKWLHTSGSNPPSSGMPSAATSPASPFLIHPPPFSSFDEDASASEVIVPPDEESAEKQQPGSAAAEAAAAENGVVAEMDTSSKSSSQNLAPVAASPKPPTAAASSNQPLSDDPFTFSDYFVDVDIDPMQLADEDYNAGAALKKIFDKPEDSISNVNIAQVDETQPAATLSLHRPISSTALEQPVSAFGDFQTNSLSQLADEAGQQKEADVSIISGNIASNNLQPASLVAPQPPQNPPAQNPPQAPDGSNGISSTANQPLVPNATFDNNIPAANQGPASSQVPSNANHQAPNRSQNPDFNLGPTAYYYQGDPSPIGQRPYAVPPMPLVQQSRPPGPQTRPAMPQQNYPYGRPRGPRRRSRQNTLSAPYSVMDFGHCSVTPTLFNSMVYDGSANSLAGSDLWPGMHQDVFNMTAMADPTLPLNPSDRLQERVAQLNLGMVPIPNLLPSMTPHPQQALSSVPQADNRMIGNGRMMNYGTPGMESYPSSQQGLGAMADAANYNIIAGPQMMMTANNIPGFQNYQPPQNLPGQMNPITQQWHPSFGNWPEYPAAQSSQRSEELQGQMDASMMQQWLPNFGNWPDYPAPFSRRPEEMQQSVTMNPPPATVLTSTHENVTHNLPFNISMTSAAPQQQAAAPPTPPSNPQQPIVTYSTMFGEPYAPKGPHM